MSESVSQSLSFSLILVFCSLLCDFEQPLGYLALSFSQREVSNLLQYGFLYFFYIYFILCL